MLLQRLSQAERLNQFVTYLYIPYQFLQIVGYRSVGKRCAYQWRRYRPEPVGPTLPLQHFVALLFPTMVCSVILVLQIVCSIYLFTRFYSPQTPWAILLVLAQPIPFSLYGGWMILDFLRLRR